MEVMVMSLRLTLLTGATTEHAKGKVKERRCKEIQNKIVQCIKD
jgi:hypothetical protein